MKKNLKGYAKLLGGGGANKVHYGRCASDESSYFDQASLDNKTIKYLFYGQIIVALIHYGLSCCYLVFYE